MKMKRKATVPEFQSEAEEAQWWYRNRARLGKDFREAAKKGSLRRLDSSTLRRILSRSKSRVVSVRLPEQDIEMARQQAQVKGLPYQTYIKSLLHQAIRQAK